MIVKIQRPLYSSYNGRKPSVVQVLIYNKDRSVERLETFTKKWEEWFGDELKRYAYAHMEKRY